VRVCVCVAKHQPMKAYSGMDVYYRVVLASTRDGNEWSDLLIDRSTLEEYSSCTVVRVAAWDPKPVWTFWRRYILPLWAIEPRTVKPVDLLLY
jgi:hypothetical protein